MEDNNKFIDSNHEEQQQPTKTEHNQEHSMSWRSQPRYIDVGPSSQLQSEPYRKKRTSGKSVFSAFMAGAIVVGSLMFVSDKMDLFSGGSHPLAAGTPVASVTGSNNGGVKTASVSDMAGTNTIASISKQASPAVVKIETKEKAKSTKGSTIYDDPFFRQFFGGGGMQQQPSQQEDQSGELQPAGIGSGFIFEKTGYILTNEHVIDGADEIDVYVQGSDEPYKAKLLGNSYDLDLAVLKIEGSDFPTLPIGNSDNAEVGEWVVAIGNPYDFDYTVTAGLLSAKGRPISISDTKGTRNYKNLIQTDAAINPGNSGGPLLNMDGEVIGINTAVNSEAQGIGFAIPTSTISSVLEQLKNNVAIPKEPSPYIGVSLQNLSQDMLNDLKIDSTEGALVADVQRKTPAFEAGIRPYDVIVAVNGSKVATTTELTKKVQAAKVGDKLTLTVIRDGSKQDIVVKVGDKNTSSDTNK
ncbi:S1C family serine protease [Paenibacillus thalictri]|uniref:PDZ domain-containing protein n=1 Tax=Paenibacillus thalictri TaxID=2527873 RepID=A0A4V2J4A0_9BACL|nr:trypsin-like peptidase domain-containing protein [Paenibacillus thalictri]TBL78601.1 PDZ domain-containing protein [Paenibacillus thalictri]